MSAEFVVKLYTKDGEVHSTHPITDGSRELALGVLETALQRAYEVSEGKVNKGTLTEGFEWNGS